MFLDRRACIAGVTRNVWLFVGPSTRTVDVHIAMLRSKLEENPAEPQRLITVHGIGYKLILS